MKWDVGWPWEGKLVVGDRESGEWLRNEPLTVYSHGPIPDSIVRMMRDGDTAYGRPGMVYGVSLQARGGFTRITRATSWGIDEQGTTGEVMDALQWLEDVCHDNALEFHSTAAAASTSLLSTFVDLKPTPPRYRQVSHAALHAGPIIHVRGGSERGAVIDVRAAYLHALYQPMPVGRWRVVSPRHRRNPAKLLEADGIVNATVTVPETEQNRDIGALPIQLSSGRMAYPTGTIRGVWPTTIFRPAIEGGHCTLDEVHYVLRPARVEPLFDEFASYVSCLPKALAKPLYARLWGKMSSQGYWQGTTSMPDAGGIPGGRLFWRFIDRPFWKAGAPWYYCPDLAAWIVSINHANMMDTIHKCKPGSLIAAHVDSIFTSDVETAREVASADPEVGEWKLEGVGRLRYYSQGRYCMVGDGFAKYGYNGMDERVTDPVAFELACHALVQDRPPLREWDANPKHHITARSHSMVIDELALVTDPVAGPCPTETAVWNSRGYAHNDVESALDDIRREDQEYACSLSDDDRRERYNELKDYKGVEECKV